MRKYRIVLWMVECGDGLSKTQINQVLSLLEEDEAGYLPLEIEGECNSVALGFAGASYCEELDYNSFIIQEAIVPVLEDWDLESSNCEYTLHNGEVIYMGCDYETSR